MGKKLLVFLLLALISSTFCQADDNDIYAFDDQLVQQGEQNLTIASEKPENVSTAQPTRRREFKLDIETLLQHPYQMAAVGCIFLYLILYRIGKSANIQVMQAFYERVRNYVDNNFAHVGFNKTHGESPFIAESPHEALFYATGRQNIDYLQVKFNMIKREDLLYRVIYEIISPQKDTIVIDVPVQSSNSVVFCVASSKKSKLKAITQKYLDIAKLAGSFDVKGLSQNLHVLAEGQEAVDLIFDSNIVKKLNDIAPLIQSIHYTDQKMFSQSTGHIRATLLASNKNKEKYLQALELVLLLADKVHGVKLPANYKTKAAKARQVFNASVEKEKMEKHQEDLRKKKEDKRKQEEAWIRSLPADKQKREDEKRKKKEINKIMKSRVMKA